MQRRLPALTPPNIVMNSYSLSVCLYFGVLSLRAEVPPKEGGTTAPQNAVQSRLTLDAVISAVISDNPSIKEARSKWEALKLRVPQAAAWDDLKIGIGSRVARFVRVTPNSFGDQMLNVEQMIPISGKNQSRSRIAAAEALLAVEELRRKQIDVLAKAKATFYTLANAYALLGLNSADEALAHQTLDVSRAKFASGGQSQADVLSAEIELTKIHEAGKDLEQKLSDAQTQLSVLMNRDPFKSLGKPVAPESTPSIPSQERLRSLILSHRPELRMAEDRVIAATAKLDLAKREWIPDPTLSVQAQRYNSASQGVSEVAIGISINVPWFNRKKYRAEEQEAAGNIEAAQRGVEAARAEALGLLRDRLRKIETNHHHVQLFRDQLLPTAKQTVEANRAGYETNKTGFLELITSQRSLRELQSMYQEHLTDYETAVIDLEAIIGADLPSQLGRQESVHPIAK